MTLLISMPSGSSRGYIRAVSYLASLHLFFFGLHLPVESGAVNTFGEQMDIL